MLKLIALATFVALPLAGSAAAQETKLGKTPDGKAYLQTPDGLALYVFDKDGPTGGGSSCNDACTKTWPPFGVSPGVQPHGDWTIVKRPDGTEQWAYKGRPLYTFAKDHAPGQTDGNSFNGNSWHIAQP